jgi:aminoglycoside phosphotransferase (APT) family kinase protein
MSLQQLPQSADSLDDSWISRALDTSVQVIKRESVGVGQAFACRLYRLTLDGPPGTPGSVLVKMPIEGDTRAMLDTIGAYTREIEFYREIAPHLPVRTPRIYSAEQATDSTDFLLVMEDLTDECMQIDLHEGFTRSQAEAAIDGLTQFHAWSWGKQQLLQRHSAKFWPTSSGEGRTLQQQYGQLFSHVWGLRRDALVELLPPSAVWISDRFVELQPRMIDALATPTCITHGELRSDNLFFDAVGKPVFIDFQAVGQECGIRELQYLLCTSMLPERLAGIEDAFIQRYCDGLADYEPSQAREQYRWAAAYNLLWPIIANVRWEASDQHGRDRLDDMARRLGAAVDRHASVDLF